VGICSGRGVIAVIYSHIFSHLRKETKSLQSKNEQLTYKVRKAQKRTKDMELQLVDHGSLHEKMRQQIKIMDEQAQNSAQQVCNKFSVSSRNEIVG
jgi:F0F1-type ATP synthase membrane subunit b/b'